MLSPVPKAQTPSLKAAPLPLGALGLLAGAGGGLGGALVDFARALGEPDLARLLPEGAWRLLLLLAPLYAAIFAAVGLAIGLGARAILRWTPLGELSRDAGDAGEAGSDVRVRWPALLLGVICAAALLGALVYPLTLGALQRFHHRVLIALLVGAGAAGLLVPAAVLALLAAGAGKGPGAGGVPVRLRGPLSLYASGWMLGALVFAGGIAAALLALQGRPRMTPALRALNLALWTPAMAIGALALGHLIGRWLAGRRGRAGLSAGPLASGWAVLLLPAATLAVPVLLGAALYRETLRVLDLRPFTALLFVAAAAALCFARLVRARQALGGLRAAALVLLPLALWGVALLCGRHDRARKAALAEVPLAAHIIQGAAAVLDLDRDGAAARLSIGGTDCDDLDPDLSPSAFDWPDNGIDENCNGHDATLAGQGAPVPFPPLPSGLPAHPSVVLITIDALRADHMSAYGYPRRTTPNLDALASGPDGVRFARAWAHAPSTRYSVPAILTGRYPSTIAWGPPHIHWPPEVLPENHLISEMLRARGYRTTALLSYHYFEPTWGLARGFDDYDTHLEALHSLGGDPAATSGSSARELADLALTKLATLTTGTQPFFLWVHFYDPHFRYQPHPPPPGEPPFGDGETDLYDGEIRYTDEHIGRVLTALRTSPAWPSTIVLVTSDHGEGLGEHGIPPDKRHGYHLYANQTQVPLLLRVPGLDAAVPPGTAAAAPAASPGGPGRVVTQPVGHVDLVPTLLHLAGGHAADEPQLPGRPLLPLVTGQPDPGAPGGERVVFQEVMYEGPTVRKAMVTPRFHLIENLVPDGTTELYDLVADPGETRDLQGAGATRGDEKALRERLAAWIDDSAVPRDFARRVAGNLSATPLPAPIPLGARIGDFLEVVGAELRTPAVARGETAEVAVVLRALRRVPPGYRLFAHLRPEAGGFTNADHDLLEGLLPPQRLRPGMYVRDVTRFAVPRTLPPGPARVVIGLFRRDGRAPVSGPPAVADTADRSVRVTTLTLR